MMVLVFGVNNQWSGSAVKTMRSSAIHESIKYGPLATIVSRTKSSPSVSNAFFERTENA